MDHNFLYVADPKSAVRMSSSRHLEETRRAQWRNARHVEEVMRSRRAAGLTQDAAKEELVQAPAAGRVSWRLWSGVLHRLLVGLRRPAHASAASGPVDPIT